MRTRSAVSGPVTAAVLSLALAAAPAARAEAPWFKIAPGFATVAMDDVNGETFSFFDDSVGYDLDDLRDGFALSFHLGYDLNRTFALGFSWDHQYARTSGFDRDVEGKFNADANFFMGHGYWTPVRSGRWSLGGAVGLGPVFAAGKVKEVKGTVSFGESKLSGTGFSVEVLVKGDWRIADRQLLELTAGWRQAEVPEIEADKRPVYKANGDRLPLDYSGVVVKLGWKLEFGGDEG